MHAGLSEGPGSMEWHTDFASQYGLDAIWWTDHDWRVSHTQHTRRFDFESATVEPGGFTVTEPDDAYPNEYRYLERIYYGTPAPAEVAIVDTLAQEGSRSLRLRAWDSSGSALFRNLTYRQTGGRRQNMWSLAARMNLSFAVFPETLDPSDARFFVDITLSEHPSENHRLRYVVGSMDGEDAETVALPYDLGQWNVYDLDLTGDAIQKFTTGGADSVRGEDNNLYEIKIGIEVRNSADATVFFDGYGLDPDETLTGEDMMNWTRTTGSYYATTYPGVSHLVGTEISWRRAQHHMNGFAPSVQLVDYSGHVWSDTIYYAVEQIHEQGGAVSLDHMFGIGIYGDPAETQEQKEARIDAMKEELLATRAYRTDALEVGYRWRQGIELDGFVEVWDTLTGNAVFLTANGVTDSHGSDFFHGWGPWIEGNVHRENNFVTWLWAPALTETDLVKAILAGRAFFGDPYAFGWDSTIDLVTAEGFPMGRVILTDRATHDVQTRIESIPPSAQVRLLQGEIREDPPVSYLDVNWLRDEIRSGTVVGDVYTDTVNVDTSLPSFVRLEVRDGSGQPLAYSNPVHFVRSVPAVGIPAPRVAARLGDLRILRAEEFTLLDATLSLSPAELVIVGDEETVGLGTLEIDCAVLGPPDAVIGGGTVSWEYAAGILTLIGFNGTGSVARILWGPVDAPATRRGVEELALGRARPNPFGRGLVAEYALPRASPVTLEVVDVRGRRVRILVDDREEPGRHRISWDGTDHYGRPVADGVYFLRLHAAGRTLTTKAVKLH
jgi:hypothetical protein